MPPAPTAPSAGGATIRARLIEFRSHVSDFVRHTAALEGAGCGCRSAPCAGPGTRRAEDGAVACNVRRRRAPVRPPSGSERGVAFVATARPEYPRSMGNGDRTGNLGRASTVAPQAQASGAGRPRVTAATHAREPGVTYGRQVVRRRHASNREDVSVASRSRRLDVRSCSVGSAGGFRGRTARAGLTGVGCLPPPHRTVRAVLPHTALRRRSPAGKRERGSHCSAESIDAELGRPLVIEAADPVASLESVLGAGEDREAFADVAVDLVELVRGVST
jgi:hypothetical protein